MYPHLVVGGSNRIHKARTRIATASESVDPFSPLSPTKGHDIPNSRAHLAE